jgi:MobA/VirD2-like, nuclease domain
VIGKVLRGEQPAGLIYYLYGPGKHEEHTDPHIVAGWRHPAELEPPLRPGGRRNFRRLNGLLQQTLAALGAGAPSRPVWHCVARAAPGDRMLSDDEWALVAGEMMHCTGLAPYGQEDDAVRWVAIRHADDHIHIVATLARQDGRRPRVSNDYYRVREACLAVEDRFGLRRTAPGDRTAAARPTRAENEKTRRRGWQEAPRVTLKREVSTAAAAAFSEHDFFTRLQKSDVLVRKRLSSRNRGEVTGYSVALPNDTTREGEPVWYGGGKLAADLTLPKLRQRWASTSGTGAAPADRLTPEERAAIWDHAARTAAETAEQIRSLTASGDPAAAADAAWAAGDTLHAAAAALRSRAVRQAATAYDRAARVSYGRIPRPTTAGNSLRRTARLLSAAALASHDRTLAQIALIARLAALADAVTELRQAQQHAAQAAAARLAAEHLHAAAVGTARRPAGKRGQAPTMTDFTREAFPVPAIPSWAAPTASGRPAPNRPGRQQRRGLPPCSPRGPAR